MVSQNYLKLVIVANSCMCDLGDKINNFLIAFRKFSWNWGVWNWLEVQKNEQKHKTYRKLMGDNS